MSTTDVSAARTQPAGRVTFRLTAKGFVAGDADAVPYIQVECREPRRDWLAKQEASMPEYLEELEVISPLTLTLYKLFDAYIAAALHGGRNARVLDVGCGLNREWPPYVETLKREQARTGHIYAGLDPIAHDVDRRRYPFVCGRLEDLPAVLEDRFDLFVFATSLDHFENIDEVARAVRRLAADDALCVFWVGLHDAVLVGEQCGARAYRRLFTSLAPPAFLWQYLRNLAGMPVNYVRLVRRRGKMRRGRPLDKLHFHYFTEASLEQSLRKFGTRIDSVIVPGTGSVFTTVRLAASGRQHGSDAN